MYDNRIYVPLRDFCEQLNIPVYWDSNKREANIDVFNKNITISDKTPFKVEGVIPDEQTALSVGKLILEKYAEKALEYETEDKIYFLRVDFIDQYNAWIISQTFKFKNESMGWAAGGDSFYTPSVILNKKTGEVMNINTFSSLETKEDDRLSN